MAAPGKSRFDFSLMGEADKRNLFSATLDAVRRFYDDPANREKFERWKTEQQSRKGVIANT